MSNETDGVNDDEAAGAQGDLFAGDDPEQAKSSRGGRAHRADRAGRAPICRACLTPLTFKAPQDLGTYINTEWHCDGCGAAGVISARKDLTK